MLPFTNLSANKDDEHFSYGMTEEIRGDLFKIAGLQVTARAVRASGSRQRRGREDNCTAMLWNVSDNSLMAGDAITMAPLVGRGPVACRGEFSWQPPLIARPL